MSTFIIKDVQVFTGEDVIGNGYVLVRDGQIEAYGEGSPPTEDIAVVSKPGYTLLPGLIDAHVHVVSKGDLPLKQSIRFGVTTVLDMFGEPDDVAMLKALAKKDVSYADFKSACHGATVKDGWPEQVVVAHDKSPEANIVPHILQSR